MHNSRKTRELRRKSDEARRRVNIRWDRDRERRHALAMLDEISPLINPEKIVQRVIVINDGVTAHEIIRRAGTSQREWAQKKRSVGL